MVSVLYIGQYKKEGKFTAAQWNCFIQWCKIECNRIIVYTKMGYNTIYNRLSFCCTITEIEMPDRTMSVHAYEIEGVNDSLWEYIKRYNYNIDREDDISHIFFFCGRRNVASLEIVDYENYVILEEPVNRINELLYEDKLIEENIYFCIEKKSDVDDLMQGESWKPLGAGLIGQVEID